MKKSSWLAASANQLDFFSEAKTHCEQVHSEGADMAGDTQADLRTGLVSARIARSIGEQEVAARNYTALIHSNYECWRTEADTFLNRR